MGKCLLAEADSAARWLQAAVLRAAARASLSHCCPVPQPREWGLCSHGQGASGSWPEGCHGGEGEAHGKLVVSSGRTQASASGPMLVVVLQSGSKGIPPMRIRVWRARESMKGNGQGSAESPTPVPPPPRPKYGFGFVDI